MHKKDAKAQQHATEGKFSHESVQDAQSLGAYLQALAQGFNQGEMRFARQDLEMVFHPVGLVNFSVEAKAKQGRMKLNLKFSWRESAQEDEVHDAPLVITAGGEGSK